MKKYSVLMLVAVFAAVLFTGCGCRNSQPVQTSAPTTTATSAPTTQATEPSTKDTMPNIDATIEDGNGPLPTNATAGADGNTDTEENGNTGEADSARSRTSATENTNATTGMDNRTHRVMPQN